MKAPRHKPADDPDPADRDEFIVFQRPALDRSRL
jgi:hypothetical protein